MAIDPDVSRAHVVRELKLAEGLLQRLGWTWDWDPDRLFLVARITAPDQETYSYEFTFDHYKELPPLIEARYPLPAEDGQEQQFERGTARCFPSGGLGYFHSNNLICAPWSRRAYKHLYPDGPHQDWDISKWRLTIHGEQPPVNLIGDMLAKLALVLKDPTYQGRKVS